MTNKSFDELNHYEKRLVNLVVRAKDLDNHDEDMFNGSVTEVAKIFLKYEKYRQFNAICDYYRDKFNIERRIDELKDKISFLERGNMIKEPRVSVANPGIIKSIAPKAIAAPEITS